MDQSNSVTELLVARFNYLLATIKAIRRHVVAAMYFTSSYVGRQRGSAQRVV